MAPRRYSSFFLFSFTNNLPPTNTLSNRNHLTFKTHNLVDFDLHRLDPLTTEQRKENGSLFKRMTSPCGNDSSFIPSSSDQHSPCLFRWGTTERTVGDNTLPTPTNTGPYVRRRSGAGVNEPTLAPPTTTPSATSTVVSVTTSLPLVTSTPTTNVTVTSPSILDDSTGGKRRSNLPPSRDEEAEAQRKHRSAQARRERRSTQSVTVEDIKAAEQQIKSQPNNTEVSSASVTIPQPVSNTIDSASSVTLSNNKIGAPSTPSLVAEHDIETERLQRVIEEKKEKARILSGGNEVRRKLRSCFDVANLGE